MEKSIENVMHLGIDFWKDFDGFLKKMKENRRKFDGKTERKCGSSWNTFLKRFWLIFEEK